MNEKENFDANAIPLEANEHKDFDALLNEQKANKEKGNKMIEEGKNKEAEEVYKAAIETIKNYKPNHPSNEIDSDLYREKLLQVLQLTKELYSNLSLVQGKQFHYGDALGNALYIIQYIDEYHDKSYIRIINWLIAVHQIDKANEIANEVRTKFKGEQLKQFDAVFNILKLKNEEIKGKQGNTGGNYLLYCGMSFIVASALLFAYKVWRNKM